MKPSRVRIVNPEEKTEHAKYNTLQAEDLPPLILWIEERKKAGDVDQYTTKEHLVRLEQDTGLKLNPNQLLNRFKAQHAGETKSSRGSPKHKLADVVESILGIEARSTESQEAVKEMEEQIEDLHKRVTELEARL